MLCKKVARSRAASARCMHPERGRRRFGDASTLSPELHHLHRYSRIQTILPISPVSSTLSLGCAGVVDGGRRRRAAS